jgi:hypothetical protein
MELKFGALSPKISEQLKLTHLSKKSLRHYDLDADAITRLHVRGLMNDSTARRTRQRLVNRIDTEFNVQENINKKIAK